MLKQFHFARLIMVYLVLAVINTPAYAEQDEPVERIDRKGRDVPNPLAKQRFDRRMEAVELLRRKGGLAAEKADTAPLSGSAKALVILVEFGGPDTFTYTPGVSRWDPIGKADQTEWTGTVGDCSIIDKRNNLTGPTQFTYNGPLHNQIEGPRSAVNATGDNIWTPDFNRQYHQNLITGNGIRYHFSRQDGSTVNVDLTGKSVKSFYSDLSGGAYQLQADIYGWVKLPHSVWWYGADPCPGRRSGSTSQQDDGTIPGAGDSDSLVRDAIDALNRTYPAINWLEYDRDHDGIVDHLWIIAAGLDESQSRTELNRTDYGEAALWAHSGTLGTPYRAYPGNR